MDNWLHKHRNFLLITLLTATLAASYLARTRQQDVPTVSIPITQVTPAAQSPLEIYRTRRDDAALEDMAALQALCDQEQLDPQTRADAAARLTRMVDLRQKQSALEGALTGSGVYPCVAVVEEGSVTIVTEKKTLTEGESALLLTMAKAHADADPAGVRVITAGNE